MCIGSFYQRRLLALILKIGDGDPHARSDSVPDKGKHRAQCGVSLCSAKDDHLTKGRPFRVPVIEATYVTKAFTLSAQAQIPCGRLGLPESPT